MTIRVTPAALAAIRAHGQQSFPNECCGLLLGNIVSGVKELVEILPIANARETEAQRNRYLISAAERFRAERQARRQGMGVIGCYHSHPNAVARPSEFDREHAPFPVESFMIVAVKEGVAQELTSWVLSEDREVFHPEEILVLTE
jgi:proteasome lid subunit RPN8/RPN11